MLRRILHGIQHSILFIIQLGSFQQFQPAKNAVYRCAYLMAHGSKEGGFGTGGGFSLGFRFEQRLFLLAGVGNIFKITAPQYIPVAFAFSSA